MPLVRAGVVDAHRSPTQAFGSRPLTHEAWFKAYVRVPWAANLGNGLLTLQRAQVFQVGTPDFWEELLHPEFNGHVYIMTFSNHCLIMRPFKDSVFILHPFHTPDSEGRVFCRLLDLGRTTVYKSLSGPPRLVTGNVLCQELVECLLIPPCERECPGDGASTSQGPRGQSHCLWALDVVLVDQETGEPITRGPNAETVDTAGMLLSTEGNAKNNPKRKSSKTPTTKAITPKAKIPRKPRRKHR